MLQLDLVQDQSLHHQPSTTIISVRGTTQVGMLDFIGLEAAHRICSQVAHHPMELGLQLQELLAFPGIG